MKDDRISTWFNLSDIPKVAKTNHFKVVLKRERQKYKEKAGCQLQKKKKWENGEIKHKEFSK